MFLFQDSRSLKCQIGENFKIIIPNCIIKKQPKSPVSSPINVDLDDVNATDALTVSMSALFSDLETVHPICRSLMSYEYTLKFVMSTFG